MLIPDGSALIFVLVLRDFYDCRLTRPILLQ